MQINNPPEIPRILATVATTAPLPDNTYNNGISGYGATITANSPGAWTVDGYVIEAGDTVLVKDEALATNNGLYLVQVAGSGSAMTSLVRSDQMNTPDKFIGVVVPTSEVGATLANTLWICNAAGPVVIGTTDIPFGAVVSGGGGPPTGPAGGALTGSYPNPSIADPGANELIGDIDGGTTVGGVTVGTGLELSGGVLTATGSGTGLTPVSVDFAMSPYTPPSNQSLWLQVDTTGGDVVINAPAASTNGDIILISNVTGTNTIDASALSLPTNGGAFGIQYSSQTGYNGTNWAEQVNGPFVNAFPDEYTLEVAGWPSGLNIASVLDSPKVGGIAVTGTPSAGQVLTATDATDANWQDAAAGSTPTGLFGDGSDGAVVATTGPLTADVLATTYEVPNGVTVNTNGFTIRATESVTVDVGGVIDFSGNPGGDGASGGGPGGPTSAGTLTVSAGGAAGQTGDGEYGNPGYNSNRNVSGGTGGNGDGGSGGGGGYNQGTAQASIFNSLPSAFTLANALNGLQGVGGVGGGSGAGNNTVFGGGGGGGGGPMIICSPIITNNGTIQSLGGAGGAGDPSGNTGGGGGGSGGQITTLGVFTGNVPAVTGGAGGAAGGTGTAGTAGSDGGLVQL